MLALLFLDLFVLHRNAREVPLGEATWLSGFWIAFSLAFGGFVWFLAGPDGAVAYWTAYLIEKSLSMDNVFVFSVIFITLAVPREYRYHVLFYGVSGPREADVGTGNKRDKQAERRRWRTSPMSPARSGWEHSSTRSGSTPAP